MKYILLILLTGCSSVPYVEVRVDQRIGEDKVNFKGMKFVNPARTNISVEAGFEYKCLSYGFGYEAQLNRTELFASCKHYF